MNTELWQAVAAGLLDALVAKMVSVTNRDSRALLFEHGSWPDWLEVQSWGALGYVCSRATVGLLWDEVQADAIYAPQIREQAIPLVEGARAADESTLAANKPETGIETYVFAWDYVEFTEVGPLATNSKPGPGSYVLANRNEAGDFGLPSLFLILMTL